MMNLSVKYLKSLVVLMVLTVISIRLTAQELNKEVFVVRPYEPTLSDAVKINFVPEISNVDLSTPNFEYSISPKRLEGGFEPEIIKPAKTIATSLPKIYNTWLKIGLGNYATSLAEFNISNVRSKDYAYGAYLYHKSSNGNIRLGNDEKVPSDYAVNNIKLYGRRIYPKMKLTGDLRIDHRTFNYYGYNTELFTDSVPPINRDSTHQRTYLLGFDLGIASTYADSSHLNYKLDGRYDHFFDKNKNKENRFLFEAGLNKNFDGLVAGLDVSLDLDHTNTSIDTLKNTIFRFSPWISKRDKDWKFLLGFEAVADVQDITNFYFYPHASLDIVIIEKVLVPFIGLSGELQKNSYMELSDENQYIIPGLHLKNTSSNLIAYGGLKGSISSAVRFRADVTFTTYKNMHFFVNDTLIPLQNQFTAANDQVDLITYHAQINVQPSHAVDLSLDAKYFDYNMLALKKPWHMPDFRIGFNALCQLGSKFVLGTGFSIIGNRWVMNTMRPDGMEKIKPVADINLKLNYNYSRAFTLFADLYNLADRSYLIWNQYPSQRFNFLFGLSYKL
jgi:hypothetical protein